MISGDDFGSETMALNSGLYNAWLRASRALGGVTGTYMPLMSIRAIRAVWAPDLAVTVSRFQG